MKRLFILFVVALLCLSLVHAELNNTQNRVYYVFTSAGYEINNTNNQAVIAIGQTIQGNVTQLNNKANLGFFYVITKIATSKQIQEVIEKAKGAYSSLNTPMNQGLLLLTIIIIALLLLISEENKKKKRKSLLLVADDDDDDEEDDKHAELRN